MNNENRKQLSDRTMHKIRGACLFIIGLAIVLGAEYLQLFF